MEPPPAGAGLDPRRLRYVLALAERRSFRRAAAFLAIPPGVLSRELGRIEGALGTRLFQRVPRRVAPTAAGEEVAELARRTLAGRAEESRDAASGAVLRVGWLDYGRGQEIQRAALAEFRAQYPHVPVQLVPAPWRDQLLELGGGSLGVGFYVGPRPGLPGLAAEPLLSYTVDAAMLPSGHRLAGVEGASLADLSGFPLHSISTDYAPEVMASVHDRLSRAGWRGRRTGGSPQPSAMLSMVACGAGWSPTMSDMAGRTPPGVAVVTLADEPLMEVDHHALWREDTPLASAFARLVFELRDAVGDAAPPGPPRESTRRSAPGPRYSGRARIARELHDLLLQDVVGSELQLEALRRRLPPSAHRESEELERVIERLECVARDGREVMRSLGPVRPGAGELALALSTAAEALRDGSRAGFRMQTNGAARELRAGVEAAAYRVGVEAVANAFRHASPSCVSVTLDYLDDLFRLRVSDDGPGMDPALLRADGRPGRAGLALMGERAESAGGILAIRSGPGAGTTVEMVVPGHAAFAGPGA